MDIPAPLLDPGTIFELDLGDPVRLEGVDIAERETPVSRPTVRGGVYEEGATAHRMRATIPGTSHVSRLTGMMLGPSAEFGQMVITARAPGGSYSIRGNLTDSVQRPGSVELGITILEIGRLDG